MKTNRIAGGITLLITPILSHAVANYIDTGIQRDFSLLSVTAESIDNTTKTVPITAGGVSELLLYSQFKGMPKSAYKLTISFNCINNTQRMMWGNQPSPGSFNINIQQDYSMKVTVILDNTPIKTFKACGYTESSLLNGLPYAQVPNTSQTLNTTYYLITDKLKAGKHTFEIDAIQDWTGSVSVTNGMISLTANTQITDATLNIEPINAKSPSN